MAIDLSMFSKAIEPQPLPRWSGPAVGHLDVNSFRNPDGTTNLLSSSFGLGAPSSSGSINFSSLNRGGAPEASLPDLPVAPSKPNLKPLKRLQDKVDRQKAIEAAMKEYEELEAATQASGFQTAQNAGNVYAQRLMQQGISPVASGVVAAQARMPVFQQLAEIGTEKEKTKLDAVSRSDALAAQIATSIANLQSSHAKTLADFNLQNVGYQLDLSKFNAAQRQSQDELESKTQLSLLDLMLRGGGSTRRPGGTAGGTEPAWDELTSLMTAANAATGSPQAAAYWQKVQGAASPRFGSNPSFPLISI